MRMNLEDYYHVEELMAICGDNQKICKKHLRNDITRTIGQFDTLSKYYILLLAVMKKSRK